MGVLNEIFDIDARVELKDGTHADGVLSGESQSEQKPQKLVDTKSYSPETIQELLLDAASEWKDAGRDGSMD